VHILAEDGGLRRPGEGHPERGAEDADETEAAERFSSELSRMLFWLHHASGPIAVGILTIAASAALIGFLAASVAWRLRTGRRWRKRSHRPIAAHLVG